MAFFSEQELTGLAIDRMVFHLVGPNANSLVILPEVNPGRFENFFLDRIKAVNFGLPYVFSHPSATRERLKHILDDRGAFHHESTFLATDFNGLHRSSAAPGALLFFLLDTGEGAAFALLKHDDETVLSYAVTQNADGQTTVDLEAISKTFVQNKDALQKSALIKLSNDGGELQVLDRKNQQKVAQYFEAFLGAERKFDDTELTERLVGAARKVILANRALVPADVFREQTKRTFEAAQGGGTIDGENLLNYFSTVMGRTLTVDEPLAVLFKAEIKKQGIEGMPLTLRPEKVQAPASVKFRTTQGIEIRVPVASRALITFEGSRIVIDDRLEREIDDTK